MRSETPCPSDGSLDRKSLAIHILVFFALWIVCFHFGASSEGIPILWLPSAFGMVAVSPLSMRARAATSGAFFVASLVAGATHGEDPVTILAWSSVVLLEISLGTCALDRLLDRRCRALGIQASLKMLAVVLFGVVPIAAALLAGALHLRSGDSFLDRMAATWAADASGMLLVLLPGMAMARGNHRGPVQVRDALGLAGWILVLLGIALLCLRFVVTPFIFLTIPFSLLAIRRGMVSAAISVWAVLGICAVLLNWGWIEPPLAYRNSAPFVLWVGVATAAFLPILIGVIVEQVEFQMQELKRSRQVLQTVIDHIPGLVGAWDGNLRIRLANKAFEDWFGTGREELSGVELPELVGAEAFAKIQGKIDEVLRGRTTTIEGEIGTESGPRQVLVQFVPDLDGNRVVGFYSLVTDISQVKAEQLSRLDSLARLQDVIDGAEGYCFIVTSLEGTIQLFNKGAERMLGWTAKEVVGKETPRLIHLEEEVRERARQILAKRGREVSGVAVFADAALHGEVETSEWTFVRKDGSTFPVQLTVVALHDHKGEVNGFLGVARDLSTDKELIRTMEEARAQAERASSMKSEFVANMSHEIRTPLNAVLGMVQLLGKTTLTPVQHKYLDMIRKSGKSLLGILEDILDFSKIEAGRLRIEPVDFQLDDILESVASLGTMNAAGKDLEVSITVDPLVPAQLHGDPLRLQQILLNLVGNALKFTSQGEVSLSIELLAREADQLRIGFRVRDTGVGMSDEQQQRIFKPFSQADSSNTRKYGGTGLGLVISKNLVELMGGHVGVRSMSRIGTEFFVTLPFPVDAANEVAVPASQGHPLHIACLDDHSSSQASLDASAARWGWRLEIVENLPDLFALLERREAVDPFDGILVDAGIPQWDDRKSIARLREICGREIPVVKMVRSLSEGPAEEGIRLLDGILVKPVTPLALLKVFKNAVAHPSALPEEARSGFERIGKDLRPLGGVHVLLVEDNAFNQVVATETLQTLGATVDLAEHGKLALDKLRKNPNGYDLVLMDVQMPVMDGFAATRAIRSELHMDLPVVAMTAGVLASDRERCMESGMDDFLTKPFEVDQLVAIFRKHLKLAEVKEPSAAAVPAQEERLFDAQPLLRSLGGSTDSLRVVRTLVRQFLSMAEQTIKQGRESSQRGDLEEAVRAFHNLKSSSATLGAMVFSATAAQIERGLQESERKSQSETIDRLERELETVREKAMAWLATGNDPS